MMRVSFFRTTVLSLTLATTMSPTAILAQSDGFIGQLMVTAANFCPTNWLPADGRYLSIPQYETLYSLLGTSYGGDGVQTFRVPDLSGRVPVGVASGPNSYFNEIRQGDYGGQESVTLQVTQLPQHVHSVSIPATTSAATNSSPANNRVLAQAQNAGTYADASKANTSLSVGSTGIAGNNSPVYVRDPYVGVLWCIMYQGIYPPRN